MIPTREQIGHTLYECEKKRGENADAVMKGISPKASDALLMEPWEECQNSFLSDADAVLGLFFSAAEPAKRVTGCISQVEEAACLIFAELCPGMVMGDEDLPHYEAAAKAVLALPRSAASTDEPVAAALARRLCQMFDSGGESQRSARARHASALFQMLNRDDPRFAAEQAKCDDDPVGYLEACEDRTAAPATLYEPFNLAAFQKEAATWETVESEATMASPSTATSAEPISINAAWQEMLDKDDRTSPEEYPEMCLITYNELCNYMIRAAIATPPSSGNADAVRQELHGKMNCLVGIALSSTNGFTYLNDHARKLLNQAAAALSSAPVAGEIELKVEQGGAGLWYATSDQIPGLLVAEQTHGLALNKVGHMLWNMQKARLLSRHDRGTP